MRISNYLIPSVLALGLGTGCIITTSDGDGDGDGGTEGATETGPGDDSTGGTAMATGDETAGPADGSDSGSTGGEPMNDYDFDDTPPDQLSQVDRMGMPAINTAVISSKDKYNAADPATDAAGDFVEEIVANVDGLHMALDDDLTGLSLTPCATMDCVDQAAPLVVPDVIKIDPAAPAGFPNGRLLADPVIDVTLAVVLLDLTVKGQDVLLFAGLPLNPPANDVAFDDAFPYLAPAH